MASCSTCGAPGHGIRGHVLTRTCVACGRYGCDKCLVLAHVTAQHEVVGDLSGNLHGYSYEGFCSQECKDNYWIREVVKNPKRILDAQALGLEFNQPLFYEANIVRVTNTDGCDAEKIAALSHYLEHPLAQGITLMYEGHKSLDHKKIVDGLRLCRNDPLYERIAKKWVDGLAEQYVKDLRSFDVPTSRAEIGGITLTLTVPQNEKEMKIRLCPSCGAGIERIAVRGQTVKCEYCKSVFQIV